MRRATRAATKGIYYNDEIICGFNCSIWISLADQCYGIGMSGISFYGWPNGLCLIEQEQCVIDIMKVILIELIKANSDG